MGNQRDKSSISIAIPSRNREEPLLYTLREVLVTQPQPDEILVIDQSDGHTPRVAQRLADLDREGHIRWIRDLPPNLNGGRNRALAETQCDIMILIDDDVMLCDGFVEKHLENYEDETVVAVAGRSIQAQGYHWSTPETPWPRLMDYRNLRLDHTERIEGVATFIGCNHSLRVDYARKQGGFDEQYCGPFRNETDFAIRIWKAGGKIVFDPQAEVLHMQIKSGGVRGKHPEWVRSHQSHLLNWRHHYPSPYFWKQLFWGNIRAYVLNKANIFHPWRLPWSFGAYGYACLRAWTTAHTGRILNTKSGEMGP